MEYIDLIHKQNIILMKIMLEHGHIKALKDPYNDNNDWKVAWGETSEEIKKHWRKLPSLEADVVLKSVENFYKYDHTLAEQTSC